MKDMKTENLVTIIIPVYNAEKFLERCVMSILEQTYKNWELLLIDDGSPDNSGRLCDDWSKKDSRVKVYHKKNGGVSSARNLGLDEAKGDWIMFVDSDDWISKDCLEVCLASLAAHNCDVLQYNYYKVYPNGNQIQESNISSPASTLEEYVSAAPGTVGVCVGGGIYRKSIIEEHGIRFDERMKYAEDGVFVLTTLLYSARMMHIEPSMYFYYMNENSAMHRINIDAYLDSLILQIDFLDKHSVFQKLYRNLVTMDMGAVCTFKTTIKQCNRIKEIWMKYRDNSPYVHIDEYHHSKSIKYVFLPLQKYSFTLACYLTALVTKIYWMVNKR